jgi:hypothetical protein
MSESHKKIQLTKEHKKKISIRMKGNQYAKGHLQTEDHKRKIAETKLRKKLERITQNKEDYC